MPDAPSRPRRGIVLGGGGVLGGAWMVGALCALRDVEGFEPGEADVLVGTSAGSVIAALLGAGATAQDLREHQQGIPLAGGPLAEVVWDYDGATGGARPILPRPGIGSPALLARNVRQLRSVPPTAALSALLPAGRGTLDRIGALVESVTGAAPGEQKWSPHPGVRIVTLDYTSGRRVVFGDPDAPRASLAEAVMASCAIPGWYAPMTIGGHRYIDGGAWSATSVDLLAGAGLDEVYVLAPMVSFALDDPPQVLAKLERRWRRQVTKRCLREVAKVQRAGTAVTVLGPGPEDLAVMGANLMAPERRARVLETALRTCGEALRHDSPDELAEAL